MMDRLRWKVLRGRTLTPILVDRLELARQLRQPTAELVAQIAPDVPKIGMLDLEHAMFSARMHAVLASRQLMTLGIELRLTAEAGRYAVEAIHDHPAMTTINPLTGVPIECHELADGSLQLLIPDGEKMLAKAYDTEINPRPPIALVLPPPAGR